LDEQQKQQQQQQQQRVGLNEHQGKENSYH
jgi:hypothetical protein